MKSLSWLLRSPTVAAVLFVSGIAMLQFGGEGRAQLYKWSQTPGVNATVDPSINWAEGMAPSAVNDSARATMAGVAKWRDDLNGTVVTGGTSTAYTVASNQVLTAFTVGHRVCFSPNLTNGATVTINVDGLGNKPLRSSPNTELGAGVLLQGTPYCATYFASNGGEYILEGFYGSPFNVPLGAIMPYVGATAPSSNFALLNGQGLSCSTYTTLFTGPMANVARYGGSCPGTFKIPDLRGRAVFGLDNMGGAGTNGLISVAGGNFDGTVNGGVGGLQNQTLSVNQVPNLSVSVSGTPTGGVTVSDGRTWGARAQTAAGAGANQIAPGSASGSSNTFIPVDVTAGSISGSFAGDSLTSTGATSNGGGAAHPILPPAMTLPYIIRIF